MAEHDKKPQQASTANATSRISAVRPKAIPHRTRSGRPHVLDAGVAVALLLRRIHEEAKVDPAFTGNLRKARLAAAVSNVVAMVREVIQVSTLSGPVWSQVQLELAHALRGIGSLRRLHPSKDLDEVTLKLKSVVSWKSWEGATHAHAERDSLSPLGNLDHLELAAQSVIAACRETALFSRMKPGDDHAQLMELMPKLQLHFDIATHALQQIRDDRRLKEAIRPDVLLAKQGMDQGASFILGSPKMPWNRLIAAAWDAEARLLHEFGITEPRAYRGTISPDDAASQIKDAVDSGSVTRWTSVAFTTPQQAVTGIGVAVDEIFNRQLLAVANVRKELEEPPPPAKPSILDALLEVAIKTALAGGAGMIGAWIGKVAGNRFDDRAFTTKYGDGSVIRLLPKADQDAIRKELVAGSFARNVAVGVATDATKEFFKVGMFKLITGVMASSKPPSSNGRLPMTVFEESSTFWLSEARLQARTMMAHLSESLVQADISELNELYRLLIDQGLPRAYEIQYGKVMEEWQNLKAKANSDRPNRQADRDAHVDEHSVAGALDLDVRLDTDHYPLTPSLEAMRLTGGEFAARQHFRRAQRPLSEVGLNQRFRLRFAAYGGNYYDVNVGVGPDHGLDLTTLGKRERVVLRVVAAQRSVQTQNFIIASGRSDAEYARFSEADVENELRRLIRQAQRLFTTGTLA